MKEFTLIVLPAATILFSAILTGFGSHRDNHMITDFPKYEETKPAATVGMTNTMKFTPDTVRIESGGTVRWNNSSLLAHSVTGDPTQSTIDGSAELPRGASPFNSGILAPEETYTHTFSRPGTYQYFCIPHEGTKMYGWVIVEK